MKMDKSQYKDVYVFVEQRKELFRKLPSNYWGKPGSWPIA